MEAVYLTRKNYSYYEKQKKENEKKKESNLNSVFESILDSFTAIYGPACRGGS